MALTLWLAVQASAAPGTLPVPPIQFDLATARSTEAGLPGRCGAGAGADLGGNGNGNDIVVCGRRGGGDYPMEEMERRYATRPLRAEVGIGGGSVARAYTEQVELAPGQVSKRAMIGIKLPF